MSTSRLAIWAGTLRRVVLWLCVAGYPTFCLAADAPPAVTVEQTLLVRLLDRDGKPVEGAHVGTFSVLAEPCEEPADEAGWQYRSHAVSDRNGLARIAEHPDLLTRLVARHVSRKLVAIRSIGPEQFKGTITVTMQPECWISGRLVCKELEALDRSITWNAVYVYSGDKTPLARFSEQPTFHFCVPPGTYRLKAYGIETHNGYTAVSVPPDRSELELEPINLPPKRWALLQGQPAPELEEIIGWKNSRPLKLSELQGKVILLEFWGSWCGPCVGRMPDLFSLHDKYHDQGLMIVGIHVDVGEGIDSAAKLDERLADVKKQLWNDRDIPFPVALVLERRVPFRPDVESKAGCPLAAEYGIDSVPTGILIDRQGRIVGRYFPSRESDEAVLRKTLEGKWSSRQ